ncbi:MAG: extracellular solute-binding protein [Bacteroidia bacterium]|nr:extracellular solute-binding protein [Bacteroidia bacterium]
MGLKIYFILLLCLSVISGCYSDKSKKPADNKQEHSKTELSGNFTITGAYALHPLAQEWADDFMKLHPGVKIEVLANGTGQGLNDLIEKKSALAMISRPLLDEEKDAGIWVIPVAKDGVAPIVNQNNPYLDRLLAQGLSTDEFQKIFTTDKPVKWSEILDTTGTEKVMVFSRADESGAEDMMAGFLFKSAADFKGVTVTGDNEMIKSIQENPLAIGFCNFSFAFDGQSGERTENIQVIPFDLDFDNKVDRKEIPFKNLEQAHRSVWLGFYPEMLCRELTFGSMGKPADPAVVEFLRYVLSDGQQEVKNAGICQLNDVYLKYSLDNLK